MKNRKITGIILIAVSIVLFIFASYIQIQVEDGKIKIAKAEKTVESGKKLFSLNPITEEVGKGLSGAADRRIAEGKRDVSFYGDVSFLMKLASVVLIVIGGWLLFFNKKGKG